MINPQTAAHRAERHHQLPARLPAGHVRWRQGRRAEEAHHLLHLLHKGHLLHRRQKGNRHRLGQVVFFVGSTGSIRNCNINFTEKNIRFSWSNMYKTLLER